MHLQSKLTRQGDECFAFFKKYSINDKKMTNRAVSSFRRKILANQ